MKRIKNAIQVARHVLENTKHTFVVGEDGIILRYLILFTSFFDILKILLFDTLSKRSSCIFLKHCRLA